ncbi:MAG: hypothetical protein PWQ87_883 [Candidatus Woesearchaeota archaeon]|nr:hypothetical protein [Candidatus Woesearchaeota archaeon]
MKKESIEEDFLEAIETICSLSNLDSTTSKIISNIVISPVPLSIEELSQKTGLSISSIFNKLKLLENLGIVKRTKKVGSKRFYFHIERFNEDAFKSQLEHIEKKIELAKESMEQIKRKYGNKKLNNEDAERLKIAERFLTFSLKAEKAIKEAKKVLENDSKRSN